MIKNRKIIIERKVSRMEENQEYTKVLQQENENLRNQLKVTEEDRDEAKLDVQKILVRYIELLAEKEGKSSKEIFKEIGEDINKILI